MTDPRDSRRTVAAPPRGRVGTLLSLWSPPALVMGGIFWASSMPALGPPAGLSDKVSHAAAYGLLGAALLRALAGATWRGVSWKTVASATALATLYGASDEIHQSLVPSRQAEIADLIADAAGAAAATIAVRAWSIIRPVFRPAPGRERS